MDRGKVKANDWTSSGSDSSDSSIDKEWILNLLQNKKWELEEIIDEERREKNYWKDAYVQEH